MWEISWKEEQNIKYQDGKKLQKLEDEYKFLWLDRISKSPDIFELKLILHDILWKEKELKNKKPS